MLRPPRSPAIQVLAHPLAFVLAILNNFRAHQGFLLAGAIAYNALLSLVPLLFNNAGSALLGTFANQTLEEASWLIDLNLWSVVYCSKAFLPQMLAQREGCIINISSIAGLVGLPGLNSYNLVKFAVRGLTESLWSELAGSGVSAVSVHPGGWVKVRHRDGQSGFLKVAQVWGM